MKRIVNQGNGNYVTAHLHAYVTDGENLLLASMIDNDSSVRGVAANISEGNRVIAIEDLRKKLSFGGEDTQSDIDPTIRLNCFGDGAYRIFTRVVDSPIVHTVIAHKSSVIGEETTTPIIVAFDGNLTKSVGERLATQFALPALEEWYTPLYNYLVKENLLHELMVYSSPMVETWRQLRAVRADKDLTEERISEIVSMGLREGWLMIPEGNVSAPRFQREEESLSEYLKQYAPYLVEKVKAKYAPLHDLDKPLLRDIATMKRTPFPAQSHAIQALTQGFLQGRRALFAVGDMGTGKTICSIAVAHVLHQISKQQGKKGFSVLIMAPGIVVPKWITNEILPTLPWARTRILQNYQDVLKYRREKKKDGIEFVIISRDRSKLGMKHRPAVVWKRLNGHRDTYAWHCGCCGNPVVMKEDGGYPVYAKWEEFAEGKEPTTEELRGKKAPDGLPIGFEVKWKSNKKTQKCSAVTVRHYLDSNRMPQKEERICGEPLSRPALKERFFFRSIEDPWTVEGIGKKMRRIKQTVKVSENIASPRWEPARLIKKYLQNWFDLGIIDEVHQMKGDSGQGAAFASLASACQKLLLLTGTLTGGKASDIYRLLFRTGFNRLAADGFTSTDPIDWVRRYGVLETIIKHEEEEEGVVTRRKRDKKTVRELPGIAPQMFVRHIMDSAVFVELPDMGLPTVKLDERPVFCEPDPEHMEAYREFHSRLEEECMDAHRAGFTGAFAKFRPAVINYADQPHFDIRVEFRHKGEKGPSDWIVTPSVKFPENYYNAKERQLVEDVKSELAEGRGCVIYASYTDWYAQDLRISEVLAAHGIESAVLKASVTSEERIAWLEQRREEGCKVIICNCALVEVGLDLISWPTIIFFQGNDKISMVRQSARRAWRLGQTRECRVFFYVYNGTYQMEQFKQMMRKRLHALILEGRADKSTLAEFTENDQHSSLTKSVAECLVDVKDLSAKWAELAAKELPDGLELLNEDEFAAVIDTVKKKLWNQTRALCGVDLVEDVTPVDEDIVALSDLFVQQHEAAVAASYTGTDITQMDIFSISFTEGTQEQVHHADVSVESAFKIVDMSQLTNRIVMKRSRKKQSSEPIGQLGWLFDDVTAQAN